MRISISPSLAWRRISPCSRVVRSLLTAEMLSGNSAMRSRKVTRCCCASTVVVDWKTCREDSRGPRKIRSRIDELQVFDAAVPWPKVLRIAGSAGASIGSGALAIATATGGEAGRREAGGLGGLVAASSCEAGCG